MRGIAIPPRILMIITTRIISTRVNPDFLLKYLSDTLLANGITPQEVPDNYDLLEEGIIDSLRDLVSLVNMSENGEKKVFIEL